ncbi:MAG: TonB family protein [Acidobacteriaceae bacterium]|jgi:protein TonB
MTTQLITRSSIRNDQIGGGFAGSFALHGAFVAALFGWAYLFHSGQNWGSADSTAGAIQATMVNAIPLPPKQPMDPNNVLATDAPNPAPITPQPRTVEAPKPEDVPVLTKTAKPVKTADTTTPPPPAHPQPVKIDPNKAQTGDAPGIRIAMNSTQTHAGTVSVGTQDAAFGSRFAYYVQQITQKVAQQWYTGMLDPGANGHRVYITFEVERDGSLTHVQVAQPSGDATLDQTALSAVQHIDTFGPLPDAYTGSHVNVTYYFDPPPRP